MGKILSALRAGASLFGPVVLVSAATQFAWVAGKAGSWGAALIASVMAAGAVGWAASEAEARAKGAWADILARLIGSGQDMTWTVEHMTSRREGRL